MLCPLLEKIWKEEKIPKEWEEGLIIEYYTIVQCRCVCEGKMWGELI
jgi:hypothetical protein